MELFQFVPLYFFPIVYHIYQDCQFFFIFLRNFEKKTAEPSGPGRFFAWILLDGVLFRGGALALSPAAAFFCPGPGRMVRVGTP
jgi:hypothetical protein